MLPADCAAWLFDFADADCSGHITAKELHAAMSRADCPTDEEDWRNKMKAKTLPAIKKCK